MIGWILYSIIAIIVGVAATTAMYLQGKREFPTVETTTWQWMWIMGLGIWIGCFWPGFVFFGIIALIFYVPARYLSKRFP